MKSAYDVLNLFSGGLDSILAAKVLAEQGLRVLNLHYYSPFFGNQAEVGHWRKVYDLDIQAVDASLPFVAMLAAWPQHGIGKTLNPCVDCKIVLLRLAGEFLGESGAGFVSTGEVVGQRPMSQRRDTLDIIGRESGLKGRLLRPLCARHLPETGMELAGLVERERLLDFCGRGRLGQLALAEQFGIADIPGPGGGCRLTERENARRYWALLARFWANGGTVAELAADFHLANLGRMLINKMCGWHWLAVGRNKKDNEKLLAAKRSGDLILKLAFPGPMALARDAAAWPTARVGEACDILAAYAPQARLRGPGATIYIHDENGQTERQAQAARHETEWFLPSWEAAHEEIKAMRKARQAQLKSGLAQDTRGA